MSDDKLLTIREASEKLAVSIRTLRLWDKIGKLKAIKTLGGHRRYLESVVEELMDVRKKKKEDKVEQVAIYSRVSSNDQKQKGDLDRQAMQLTEYCIKKSYTISHMIKDVGSGLSDGRIGFNKLVDLVTSNQITKIVIENKDRLTRYQYNLIEKLFSSYGVEIICMNKANTLDENDELVNDVIMLMASFSGKLYGRRSAKKRKLKK